ncbi:MAG: ABC transporter permease [Coriobacteriia bacterium]|nr:ABC transporter permease [Coriobacteriia bacterium]
MNLFRLVVRNTTRRPGRFIFTLLGIVIGMAAFVALLSLGGGMRAEIQRQARAMGATIIVTPSDWCTFDQISIFTGESLPASLQEEVLDQVRSIEGVFAVPYLTQMSAIQNTPVAVIGIDPEPMLAFSSWEIADGQYFSANDQRAVVLGAATAETFGLVPGDTLTFRGETFPVIGVLEPVGNIDDIAAYLPLPVAQVAFDQQGFVSYLGVQVADLDNLDSYISAIYEKANVAVNTNDQLLDAVMAILGSVEVTLQAIAGISLIAAAFGIINTMMTAIYERRREIGILRAIGSKRSDIFKLFLLESSVYGLLGGIFGAVIGVLVSLFAAPTLLAGFDQMMKGATPEASINPATLVLAVAFSILISVVSGIYPAWKAANLTPVEAISYE